MTTKRRAPIILQLGPRDFAVAVWAHDQGDVPIYRIVQRDIKAATVARQAEQHERG